MELRFLRDTDKREIDFVVLQDSVPLLAVECKTGERSVNPAMYYYKERTEIPEWYQVYTRAPGIMRKRASGCCRLLFSVMYPMMSYNLKWSAKK